MLANLLIQYCWDWKKNVFLLNMMKLIIQICLNNNSPVQENAYLLHYPNTYFQLSFPNASYCKLLIKPNNICSQRWSVLINMYDVCTGFMIWLCILLYKSNLHLKGYKFSLWRGGGECKMIKSTLRKIWLLWRVQTFILWM